MAPLIIVGTGLAGYTLAKEFRKLDAERPLLLLTADDGRNYSKPMLSTGFGKAKTADELAMNDPSAMAAQLKAEIKIQVKVQAIDTTAKTVTLDSGEVLPYSALVLAWGAEVFRPPMKGDGLDAVYAVNDLLDYAAFRQALDGKKRVAIIGGGLIGCEFANDLSLGGFDATVIEPMGRALPTLLPEASSAAVQAGLEGLGVKFALGAFASEVNRTADGVQVLLSDGRQIDADVVLSAVGLRPRIAVAREAGITVNRGVVTDRLLKTSAEDVYAIGDCAEVEGLVLLYVLPLMAEARALAKTLAGQPTQVDYPPMPVAIKTPACPVVVAPPPVGVEGQWTVAGEGANTTALFHDPAGALRGFALTGEATAQKNALAKQLPALLA